MRTKRIPIAPIPGNLTPFWTILFILMLQLRCSHLKSDHHHNHSKSTTSNQNYVLPEEEDESAVHRFADSDASLYKFQYGLYNVTIPENSIGKTYVKCVPQELFMGLPIRGGGLDDVKYRIVGGDRDKLFKAEERIIGDFAFLTVRTRTSNVILNREKNEAYKLKIRASIHAAPSAALMNASSTVATMETETFVHVQVLDRNDLSPLFYPTHYAKTVPEDMPVHTSILKVSAEDADLGINGEIYYSFLDENDYFTIHPTSGVIMLIRRLQYVQTSQFNLVVLANDRGAAINRNSHQASRANVTIHVQQVNLYAPEIYVNTLSSTSPTSAGTAGNPLVYGIVKVSDKDAGRHGEIKRLQIVDGDPDRNFLVKPTGKRDEFYIEISKFSKLENAPRTSFNLTLQAEDNGVPARSSYKVVPVEIRSGNNNLPVFTKQLYEVAIAESSPPNMPIIRLKVSDPDFGKNALVFLEIVAGNEGGEFRINPDTGMLYTQKPLDAEYKAFYTLTVTAIDQANVGERKQSSAKVKINILDVNDNDPIFEATNQTITIDENELAGTFVTKLTARDRDSGENSYISYSIANLERVPFEIDHFTGVIRTTTLIDYETMRREYTLRVRASDWGLPYRRQTETELRIRVRNVNDNRPQFERINCLGKIVRDIPVGSDVFTLSAIDFDANDFITYRLIGGNEDGCFQLDSTSGIISVGCDLTDVGAARRTVNVSSTDGTHFSDEMSMQIELVTDNKRSHSSLPADESNELLFNGYSTFECRETGVARRLAEILATAERNNDKELHGSSEGSLVALTPSRYGENVHSPEFVNFPQQILLNESVQLGETVTWIHAHDKDLGYNGKLIYWISSGDSDSVFRIDPDSGELQVIGYLDRERQDEYILNITVSDMGQPKRYSSKLLPVTMLDNNDNRPVFQKSLVSLHIKEDVANGTKVYCLNATDADSGNNGAITYLMQTAFREFGINETTGCVYLTDTLDRERQEEYEIRVTAKDKGVPALTSQALVNVIVDDVNDNAPMFGVQEFIFKIREDIPRGTVVASVEATDFDRGRNAAIFFVLKEDAIDRGLFKIDKDTGVIRTQGYLDYETRQVHNLIVSAIDCGTPALTSDMPVVIEVVDVNENRFPPEFDDFVYTGKVKENQPKGSIVMNVTARDLDLTGPEARISYSIRGGDGLGVFAVNDQGSIRTLSHLDAETKSHYWLTLCAQDNAIVPLSNCVKIYIAVENENDNVPLTDKPVYYVSVPEGSPANTEVIQLEAIDIDRDPTQRITYMITSGHPGGYFKINQNTGVITTTERKLDRENLQEHILEVSISDNGSPALSSTTKVVITVDDINDCSPEFDQRSYKIEVPSTVAINESIFQVQAFDDDKGENGRISYYIKSGKGRNKFRIDSHTGYIYLTKPLESKKEYELNIKAEDNGHPKRNQSATVNIVVNTIVTDSPHPPVIKTVNSTVDVIESDRPGFPVTLIQATDEDNDTLSYNISDGDYKNEFYIGRDSGNILLAKCLDWETKSFYNLTVTVSDGTHVVSTQLYVQVININDNRPQFTKDVYYVNISENIEEESVIMQLHATDKDTDKIFYSLYAAQDPTSLSLFRIDSMTGNVLITQRLDYERNRYHVLIVMAKDQGTPSKPNYAKIVITVYDNNDHAPEFTSKIVQCKIPESAAIGSKVVQLYAIDQDNGRNAELKYSIVKGNVGNIFNIEPALGIVTLAKNLNINEMQEYMLQVKATDLGVPPLSSQVPVHVIITMSENDPPKFVAPTTTIEIVENQLVGTFVTQVETRSSSSVFYEIVAGNEDVNFHINPSTGVITTNRKIDYEKYKSFNLTVKGTNMASASSNHNVLVHMLDVNDNAPYFVESEYSGQISESAKIGSFVYLKDAAPVPGAQTDLLILKVADQDTGINAIVEYKITDDTAGQYFGIDTPTGAIKLLQPLDYEAMTSFEFSIAVSDMGTPRLYGLTPARVRIQVLNENDCPPIFNHKEYNTTLFTPTYNDFIVLQLNATDADADGSTQIRYDIVDGNTDGCFSINALNGIIVTRNIEHLGSYYVLHVRASDGLYSTIAQVYISVEPLSSSGGFAFQKPGYEFSVVENSTKVTVIGIVNVVGNFLHENVEYYIMNPTTMFEIGKTSGAIKTTGRVFDRETDDAYVLIIEAKSALYNNSGGVGSRGLNVRRAHVLVNVSILDVNDNCPIFVNLPYYATVPVDETRGTVITRVKAVDLDSMENGEVRYELKKGNGELFRIDRRSGEISLKQTIESHNGNYNVLVAAYDNGITPCSTEVVVNIKVVDKSMPVFDKQFYSDTVSENVDTFSALTVQIRADSPLKRKLIYTIAEGNDRELFEIDYRNGVIYVVNELDYESQDRHELIVRATDSISGIFAAVTYAINVEDANDCYPIVEEDNYNVTLAENLLIGTQILKINASDCDTGVNSELSYFIQTIDGDERSNLFHIEMSTGNIYLKNSLDYEKRHLHHIVVMVRDHGIPALFSLSNVWITVTDVNDNAPKFVEPSFSARLSMHAVRGQFVTMAKAHDLDSSDNPKLVYKIIDGNNLQTYAIRENSGVITLHNIQNFTDKQQFVLNVSVTDGVHTSYSRVKVLLLPENDHAPTFIKEQYEAGLRENQAPEVAIVTVKAWDPDPGKYGHIKYDIFSDTVKQMFSIDETSGTITSKVTFDREQQQFYDIIVRATDGGGKFGFATVKVEIGDENDNQPYFNVAEYKAVVKVNQSLNTPFIQVKAVDNDYKANSEISYVIDESTLDAAYRPYIALDEHDGSISFTRSPEDLINKLVQFFVRASDRGEPPLQQSVPVSIQVIAYDSEIPQFEKAVYNLNTLESTPPGSILTKLRYSGTGNFTTKISIAADNKNFFVTESGELLLMQTLDREEQDVHNFIVCMETTTSPSLYAYAEVNVYVQDENDNTPKFDAPLYSVEVPENMDKVQSPLIKITATDADIGPNGDIRYTMEDASQAATFDIDQSTGWITLLTALDREVQSEYNFNVLASDNGHDTKHVSKVPVSVKVLDYNDNPAQFKEADYHVAIAENSLPGTVLTYFSLGDLDLEKASIDYFIMSGDNFSQFQIGKTGELFLANALDREEKATYNLSLYATDGKFVSKTNVFITVKDVNDNMPICRTPRYKLAINESTPLNAPIVKIDVVDYDENSYKNLRYYLTGNHSDDFLIEKETGVLRVAKSIDREQKPKYILNAHVQDGQDLQRECVSELFIAVLDLNDNRPEFSMPHYLVSVSEDAPVQTVVTKVHATDKDFGLNRKISYSFADDDTALPAHSWPSGYFSIGESSGIVKLVRNLDRENISIFNITIRAQDHGQPKLTSTAYLIINVLDINDNPPEFIKKDYLAYVWENATVDAEVARVHATSKDIGVNAEISYYIIGGNEQRKFYIDSKTGVMYVNAELDYEKTKAYFLTVQAIDGGVPPLSNIASINITVLDVNDNKPKFSQNTYRIREREDVGVGAKLLQITATDEDSQQNGIVEYNIERGDKLQQFTIDRISGALYVAKPLDRESVGKYVLEIRACDTGSPEPLCDYVHVNVELLDVNDNPPLFEQANFTIMLQENKELGHVIVSFNVTDRDEPPNTAPYTFDFRRGNEEQYFRLEQNGTLRTAARFNHEVCDSYALQIRVFDNGSPPLYSDTWVHVLIIEESQYPPIVRPLEITVNSFDDDFNGGFLGQVYASDQDKYDTLRFALAPTTGPAEASEFVTKNMFNISANGSLYAVSNLDIGLYKVNVTVSDGKFVAHTLVKVKVEMISAEMVRHAAVIRFGGQVSAEEFVLSNRKGFIRAISEIMHCRHKEVTIVAIQNDAGLMKPEFTPHVRAVEEPVELLTEPEDHDVFRRSPGEHEDHAVYRRSSGDPEDHEVLKRSSGDPEDHAVFRRSLGDPEDHEVFKRSSGDSEDHEVFRRSPGDGPKRSLYVVIAVRKQQIVPNAEAYFTREELESALASQIDKIEFNTNLVVDDVVRLRCPPAQHEFCVHGKCISRLELDKSHLLTVYTDVVSFVTPKYRQIYECQCKQGYDGRSCQNVVNACSSDPCPPHRLCWPANSELGYQCICAKGYSGQQCDIKISLTATACSPLDNGTCANESTAVSFTGKSYAHYKINKAVSKNSLENQFVCSVKIRTVQQTGTLLYASGRIDYSILEVLNGAVQYRFELGSGEGVVRVSSIYIADGNWHLITLERFLNTAKLTVDGKHVSQGSSPGNNGILNIHSQDLFIGAEVRPHSSILGFEDIQRGFIGCMTDIRLAQEPLPLYISGASSIAGLKRFTNVEFKCDPASVLVHLGVCGSQPCLNGGLCSDLGNNEYKCLCHSRFVGEKCEWDMDPCASSPCLFGGRCEFYGPGNYSCACPPHLSGKRCEYGKFCSPNPCRNGGVCEEGDGVPHCMCRGFSGPTCENDVNECDNQPCGSGATCINEAGSFRCICPSYLTGASCGDPLYSNTISTKLKNFSMDHLTGIFAGGFVVLVFIALCVCAVMKRSHRDARRGPVTQRKRNSYKEANLNSALDNAKYSKKANKKLCNLEMSRPISYTPSSNENASFQNNAIFVNNLDILRSYGSAGEELENIPFEYQKINITSQQNNVNSMCNYNESEMAPNKENWTEQIHMKTFCEKKLYNDKKVDPRLRLNRYMSAKSPSERLIQVDMPNICHTESSDSEQPALMHAGGGQYHWDCSDWVTKSQNPLPDITEVPGAEVADSSSFHSNDSNESKPRCSHGGQGIRKIDFPHGIGSTLNEELNSEYIESDLESDIKAIYLPQFRSNSLLRLSPIDIVKNDSYTMKSDDAYLRHPDSYLPPVHVPSETEGECSANESATGRLKTDSIHSREAKDSSEQMYLFKRGSNSDLSVHLCEIDDSELEEFIPKFENYEYSPKK